MKGAFQAVADLSLSPRPHPRAKLLSPAARVCPARGSTTIELRPHAKVSAAQSGDQILRLGLTLLNHQNKSAPTTATNKIVSFIGLPQIACLTQYIVCIFGNPTGLRTCPPLVASQHRQPLLALTRLAR